MSPLLRRARRPAADSAPELPSKVFTRRSNRAERALRKNLADGVQAWTTRAQQNPANATEVQPVLQVVGAESYTDFRTGWTKAWSKQGGAYSAASWPDRIEVGAHGVLLLPLPAGRVGVAVGRHSACGGQAPVPARAPA